MAIPVITPGGPLAKRGGEVQAFTATGTVVSWSASGGTLSGTGPAGANWTAPNVSGTYTVTATNGDGPDQVTIVVIAILPYNPSWGFETESGKKVLLFEPDRGPRQTRSKGDDGSFPFIRENAQRVEGLAMKAFHAAHYPGKQFYVTDPGEAVESLWLMDSNFKFKWHRTNLCSYSFMMKKAFVA
jgi:hypothetical protein